MSNLTVWSRRDPYFADFDRAFDALTRQALARHATARRTVRTPVTAFVPVTGFVPPAELTRDEQDAVLRLELPGVDVTNDVTVELDNGWLTVKGEKRRDESTERGFREVRYGSFNRTFTVPKHATAEAVSASYDAGVLTVRVAGAYTAPEPQPTATKIAITTVEPTPELTAEPADDAPTEA